MYRSTMLLNPMIKRISVSPILRQHKMRRDLSAVEHFRASFPCDVTMGYVPDGMLKLFRRLSSRPGVF